MLLEWPLAAMKIIPSKVKIFNLILIDNKPQMGTIFHFEEDTWQYILRFLGLEVYTL